MKKIKFVLLLLTIYNILPLTISAKELEGPSHTPYYDIVLEENYDVSLKTGFHDIILNHKIVWDEKENCFMIPLKEFLQLSNHDISFEKDSDIIKMQFYNDEFIFFKNKRTVLLNKKELGLFAIPDIKEDEIYISLQNMTVLFEISYGEGIYNQLKIDEDGKGATLKYPSERIKVNDLKESQKQYRINAIDGEILKNGIYFPILTYKKQNQIMIAIDELKNLTSPYVNASISLDTVSNTAYIKTWRNAIKDIIVKAGSNIIIVNEEQIKMPVAAEAKNNHIYIPISTWFEIVEISQQNIMWNKNSVVFCF